MKSSSSRSFPVPRAAFDGWIVEFRQAIAEARASYREDSPFLVSQIGMLDSLRYLDRLYFDLCGFAEFLKPGDRILDIGTGCGIAAWAMASMGYETEGIDIDDFNEASLHADMAAAQRVLWRVLESRRKGLRFQHYYKSAIPFDEETFDAVVAYGVLEHIPESVLDAVMHDVARVTRPGGHLMISYLPRTWAWIEWTLRRLGQSHHERLWGDRETKAFLAAHGYLVERFERIIFAPQYPPEFANRHKRLFDAMDRLSGVSPFAWFARDLHVVARKGGSP